MPKFDGSEHFETKAVHAGERIGVPTGDPVVTPIYANSTFTYDSMETVDKVFTGEVKGFVYTRHGNPTVTVLEEVVNQLEAGAGTCAFGSGMAALHAALLTCDLRPGATVLASQDLYGASIDLLFKIFGPLDIQTVIADFSDLDEVAVRARESKPRVLLAETISNPLLKLCDIEALAAIAHEHGGKLIVDNTFATPYLCQPIQHGADIVVHSATKYLCGHATATGGLVTVRDEQDLPTLLNVMKLVGGILGPFEAHEISKGIRTLPLRLRAQCENAQQIADELGREQGIAKLYYPSKSQPQELLRRMLREPYAGALVSIVLEDDTREAAFRFMDALKLCVRATSLGDLFTGVMHPASASHREMPAARRRKLGISEGLVRISAGTENVEDILRDIRQALKAACAVGA